jgi:subtilisin-like proprotein convertase family protein
VDIWLSEDGGYSFKLPLKLNTENDGGEWILLPDHPITKGRIKIKAVQHVFFDINDADLVIEDVLPARPEVGLIPDIQTLCAGDRGEYQVISSPSSSGDSLLMQISNPFQQFITITASKSRLGPLDTLRLEVFADPLTPPGRYVIQVLGISTDTLFMDLTVRIVSANIALLNPKDNEDQVPVLPVFIWEKLPAEDEYKIEVSLDPGFLNPVWSRLVTGDSMAVPEAELESNKIYFWRILPVKPCNLAALPFAAFHTLSLACKTYSAGDTPRLISATGTPSVTSTIPVPDQIQLQQVRIPGLAGTHEFVGDLSVWLKAPSGDSITLWSRQCNNLSNFNLALDDNAPEAITCPLTDRKPHRPLDFLNKLKHSNSMGNWTLRLRDFSNGAGGSLDSWSLELCGSITSSGPVATTNQPMDLFELRSAVISTGNLNFTDPDSEPQNISIMLLQHPVLGSWLKGQDTLVAGDVFTLADLQAGLITVSAGLVREDTSELISLLAFDEKNNWSGRFTFRLNILNDITILTREESLAGQFRLYPNPAEGRVYLENRSPSPARYRWLDPAGRMLGLGNIQAGSRLQLLLNGPFTPISFVQLIQGNKVLVFKVVHLQ